MAAVNELERGATAVITHEINRDLQAAYELWLDEIIPLCKSYPGNLGVQVMRPAANAPLIYVVVIRFETKEQLLTWTGSAERRSLIERVGPLLLENEQLQIKSGLDFWFTPPTAVNKPAARWKQFLVTWSAIYPLVLLVSALAKQLMIHVSALENYYFRMFCITGTVVLLIVYVVMPRYTKLVHRWLFR